MGQEDGGRRGIEVFVRARFRRLTFRLRAGRDARRCRVEWRLSDRNSSRNNSISGRTTTDYPATPTFREEPIDSLFPTRPGTRRSNSLIAWSHSPLTISRYARRTHRREFLPSSLKLDSSRFLSKLINSPEKSGN